MPSRRSKLEKVSNTVLTVLRLKGVVVERLFLLF